MRLQEFSVRKVGYLVQLLAVLVYELIQDALENSFFSLPSHHVQSYR